jgi:hypothetical protein
MQGKKSSMPGSKSGTLGKKSDMSESRKNISLVGRNEDEK